jgi:hypothetical protein
MHHPFLQASDRSVVDLQLPNRLQPRHLLLHNRVLQRQHLPVLHRSLRVRLLLANADLPCSQFDNAEPGTFSWGQSPVVTEKTQAEKEKDKGIFSYWFCSFRNSCVIMSF